MERIDATIRLDRIGTQRVGRRLRLSRAVVWLVVGAACNTTFLLPTPLAAQEATPRSGEPGSVSAIVFSASSKTALDGVVVRLASLDDGRAWNAETNASGRFAFRKLPPGEYTLQLWLLGWREKTERLVIGEGARLELEISMAPDPIPMEAVEVLLDRRRIVPPGSELPGSAQSLSEEEMRETPSAYADIHKAVFNLPGVNVQEEEGFGLRPNIGLRGTGSERTSKITLMEDGILIAPAPYAAPAAYYFPVTGRMESVEVRKGSSQIKYGPSTIGGALNLVSQSIPDRLSLSAGLDGGQHGTGRFQGMIGDSYENFGWLGQGYLIRTDGFKQVDGGGDAGYDLQDFLVKLRANTNPDASVYQAFTAKVGYYNQTSHSTYLGITDEDFGLTPNRRYAGSQEDVFQGDQQQYELQHYVQPSDAVNVTTTFYRHDFRRNWYKLQSVLGTGIGEVMADPAAFAEELAVLKGADSGEDALQVRANNRSYYAQGIQSVLGIQTTTGEVKHGVEVGIRYHADQEDRFQNQDGYRMVRGRMELTSEGAPGSQSNRVSDGKAWALYVQDAISLGDWTIIPGVRYETIGFSSVDYGADDPDRTDQPTGERRSRVAGFIPGVGLNYHAATGVDLFVGVHKGFGPTGARATEETEPEESLNYEAGARLAGRSYNAQVVGFFSDYTNVLGRSTLSNSESGTGDIFNGGEADVFGVELSAEYDPLAGVASLSLPIGLTYTFTNAEFRTAFESDFEPWGSVEIGDKLPYIAPHQLQARVGLEHERWSARFDLRWQAAMRTAAGQGVIPAGEGTDAYSVIGFMGEYEVTREVSIFLSGENLADAEYVVARRPAGPRPGLPRTISAGVRDSNR
ncbi:MAG: TonB-dependent receptor [Gemmatimonadales bacterium]